jgi:integrase
MIYRRGRVYWFEFWHDGRRIRESTGLTNKKAATQAEAIRLAGLAQGRAGIVRKARPPKIEEYVKTFLEWSARHHRPKTRSLHKLNCQTLLRFFRGKSLDQITTADVEHFKAKRIREEHHSFEDGTTISPATVNRALATLRLMYNQAEGHGFEVSNPTRGLRFLKESDGQMRVISFEEEAAYLGRASQPLKDIAATILDTGLRPDECFRLEIGNLDFTQRTVFNSFGKTRAAKRKVSMTDRVFQILKRRAMIAKDRYVFWSRWKMDQPIGSVKTAHQAAIRRAGIQEYFRLYDLRHTFATRAVIAGVDLPTLAALLGHTNITMTTRYVHPAESQKREAVAKLERLRLGWLAQISGKESPQKYPQ